jgi:6-phosphogluconolactonase
MQIAILPDADAVARQAATIIAAEARGAVAARGRFILAVSGGHTPWHMLYALAREELPWDSMHIVQVDERVAPAQHPDRNLTHLRESLLEHAPLRPEHIYAMPVESTALETAAQRYALTLQQIAGLPRVLDLAHLGLGPDGHTASLVPGDPVLNVTDADVAVTRVYEGRRRMTLTYPILNRARRILWLVTGKDKIAALARLRELPGWVCWVAGGAQRPRERRYMERLERAASAHGIVERVRFLGERSDVPRILRAADIYCQPNTGPEPFGLAFVEALGVGIPVISSAIGGATEIIDDSCGVLVEPDDVQALAGALRQFVEEPEARSRLGSEGPARARALCDPSRQIKRFAEALARVVRLEDESVNNRASSGAPAEAAALTSAARDSAKAS